MIATFPSVQAPWVRDQLCVHQLPNLYLYEADAADKRHLRCPQVVCLSIPVSQYHMCAGKLIEEIYCYKNEGLLVSKQL